MLGWIRKKWTQLRTMHSEAERLRTDNLRKIAVASPEQLNEATVCLNDITLKKAGTRSLKGK